MVQFCTNESQKHINNINFNQNNKKIKIWIYEIMKWRWCMHECYVPFRLLQTISSYPLIFLGMNRMVNMYWKRLLIDFASCPRFESLWFFGGFLDKVFCGLLMSKYMQYIEENLGQMLGLDLCKKLDLISFYFDF